MRKSEQDGGYQPYWISWYMVTYKKVIIVGLILIALLAYPGYRLFQKYWGLSPDERRAVEAIGAAENLYDRASRVDSTEALLSYLNQGSHRLGEAREALEADLFMRSYELAVESAKLSAYILDMSKKGRSGHSFTVFDVEGEVRVKPKDSLEWVNATRDMQLTPGDKIQTGQRGSALLFSFDGSQYELRPGSLIEIQKSLFNPLTREKAVEVNVNFGFLDLSTTARTVESSSSRVTTRNTSSDVAENSKAAFQYDEQSGRTELFVYDGGVDLVTDQQHQAVGDDTVVTVAQDSRIARVASLPTPPNLLSPPHLRPIFVDLHDERAVELAWVSRLPDCRYHLQISRQPLFTEPMVDETDMAETRITVQKLTPGEYYWHVSAISAEGVEGKFGQTFKFEVRSAEGRPDMKRDMTPPRLEVERPLIFGNIALVQGKTDPGVLLTINNDEADVESDGTFRHLITLPDEGINVIGVVAQDSNGMTAESTHEVKVTLP